MLCDKCADGIIGGDVDIRVSNVLPVDRTRRTIGLSVDLPCNGIDKLTGERGNSIIRGRTDHTFSGEK